MDPRDQLKIKDASRIAAGPGRSAAQCAARWHRWVDAGIIPPAIGLAPGGDTNGRPAFLFPQWAGAIGGVLFDLYDAGAVTGRDQLASMWRYFAEPHHEGGQPLIEHILAQIAAGNPVWLVLTIWRHEITGEIQPTCATRFADEMDRPIDAPTPEHANVADYVIKLHQLLARFASDGIVPAKGSMH